MILYVQLNFLIEIFINTIESAFNINEQVEEQIVKNII